MSIDKDYKVMVHRGGTLLATYTLHTECEDGEIVDVSSTYTVGDPDNDPIEDEAVEIILECEAVHGKRTVNGYSLEWFLIN